MLDSVHLYVVLNVFSVEISSFGWPTMFTIISIIGLNITFSA